MSKLVKTLIAAAALLSAYAAGAGNNAVDSVTAHVPDQSNTKRNDPKWLKGKATAGQSFVPTSNMISFLYVNIFAASLENKFVTKHERKKDDGLRLRLIELKDVQTQETEAIFCPVSTTIGGKDFFEINKPLTPQTPYYFEFSVAPESQDTFYYWIQYGGNNYQAGDVYLNGKKWTGSDLGFTTYYPVKLDEKNTIIEKLPEIFEIHFTKNLDKNKVNVFISGPCGISKGKKTWKGDDIIFLGPVELKTYSLAEVAYRLYVSYFDEDDKKYKTVTIPFTYKRKD